MTRGLTAVPGLIIVLMMSVIAVAPAAASPDAGAPAAAAWQALTRADLEAGYALLVDNHPGALPEVHDAAFTDALRAAHAKALSRIPHVSSYDGYRATLAEFANALGDGHVAVHPRLMLREVTWAGIIAAKRGPDWIAAIAAPELVDARLAGARIVSCDGVPVDSFAREVLRFHTVIGVEANLVNAARWLLVDDGNPFVTRPRACTFDAQGRETTVPLHWTGIAWDQLRTRYWKPPIGKAGFGVRQLDGGYWIAMESLTPPVEPVLAAAQSQVDRIRAARYVVIDLRGNGGGNDHYGRVLAELLHGKPHVEAVLGPEDGSPGCEPAFRASAGNIAALDHAVITMREAGDSHASDAYAVAVRQMQAAKAHGRALTGPAVCGSAAAPGAASAPAPPPPSLLRAPWFVLTDGACFSSCIGTVMFLRKLGAIQIGQPTNADTHYSEVREVPLPSGLATFSTLQAIIPDQPRAVGPFAPAHSYAGDIADTAAIERWVTASVVPGAAPPQSPQPPARK